MACKGLSIFYALSKDDNRDDQICCVSMLPMLIRCVCWCANLFCDASYVRSCFVPFPCTARRAREHEVMMASGPAKM